MRKIVQIAACPITCKTRSNSIYLIAVLCDDRTVWGIDDGTKEWKRLPAIPQDAYTPPPQLGPFSPSREQQQEGPQ